MLGGSAEAPWVIRNIYLKQIFSSNPNDKMNRDLYTKIVNDGGGSQVFQWGFFMCLYMLAECTKVAVQLSFLQASFGAP